MIRPLLRAAIWLIPAAVYVAVIGVLDPECGASFWTSVIVLGFAYGMLAVSFVAVPRGRISTVLGMPLVLVSSVYLAIEFALATIFIYVQGIPFPWVIVTQLVLAAVYPVVLFATMSSNAAVAAEVATQHADVLVVKRAVARLAAVSRRVEDPRLASAVDGLAEEFRYSPTMRTAAVRSLDAEIESQLLRLERLVEHPAAPEQLVGQLAAISGALAARNEAARLER